MDTWIRLMNLREKGGDGGKRLNKELIYIYAIPMDQDNRVVKAYGGCRNQMEGSNAEGGWL